MEGVPQENKKKDFGWSDLEAQIKKEDENFTGEQQKSMAAVAQGSLAIGRASTGVFYITGTPVPIDVPPAPGPFSLEEYARHVEESVKGSYLDKLRKGWKPHPWQLRHIEYLERTANAFKEFYEYFQGEYNAVKFWVDNNGGPTSNEEVHVCPNCRHVFNHKYEAVGAPTCRSESGSK